MGGQGSRRAQTSARARASQLGRSLALPSPAKLRVIHDRLLKRCALIFTHIGGPFRAGAFPFREPFFAEHFMPAIARGSGRDGDGRLLLLADAASASDVKSGDE